MNNTYGVFNRAVQLNPWPVRHRLPGQKIGPGNPIAGSARQGIAHALTYYEIPPGIDDLIDRLPAEEALLELGQPQKDYLSFTVYSLKQMVAAGTLSAESAWTILGGEWEQIGKVTDRKFDVRRRLFFERVYQELETEFGWQTMAVMKRRYFERRFGRIDLLKFEFLARAGEAGLRQCERYGEWARNLVLDALKAETFSEALKDEYRKSLWLEMRLIEERTKLSGLNIDVGEFYLLRGNGSYQREERRIITGSFDLFRTHYATQAGGAIDSTIKAEIGHWLFDAFNLAGGWAAELMDRLRISAYSARINLALAGLPLDKATPEMKAFLDGGYFLSTYGLTIAGSAPDPEAIFPAWPLLPLAESPHFIGFDPHLAAEFLEYKVRQRLIDLARQGRLGSAEVFSVYSQAGIYLALLYLQAVSFDVRDEPEVLKTIVDKIDSFEVKELEEYVSLARPLAKKLLRRCLNSQNPLRIIQAADLLTFWGEEIEAKYFEQALKLGDRDAKHAAFKVIARRGGAALIEVVNPWLKSSEEEIRLAAARVLGILGDPSGLPVIEQSYRSHLSKRDAYAAFAMVKLLDIVDYGRDQGVVKQAGKLIVRLEKLRAGEEKRLRRWF